MPLISRHTLLTRNAVTTGGAEARRRLRSLTVRVEQLPLATRTAVKALEAYLEATAPSDEQGLLGTLDEVVTRFERSYAEGTSITDVVGDDVVAFADALGQRCGRADWFAEQRARLVETFHQAEREQGPQ